MANDTKPRRKPKRRSGEQIVKCILDAAQELLVEEGFDKLTTNRIAERAGVSVGSVYQYFPNKQAIVAGITKRLNDQIMTELEKLVTADLPLRERLTAAIDILCSNRVLEPDLRRALLLHVPRSWQHTGIISGEQEAMRLVEGAFRSLMPELDDEAFYDRMCAMAFATRGAAQGVLLYRPEMLEGQRLTKILVDMFLGPEAPDDGREM